MNKLETINKIFEGYEIGSVWDNDKSDYYFSVIDIIKVLTDSPRPRKYWNALKSKLKLEGSELSSKLGQLKLKSNKDGKSYLTDVLDTKESLRDNMSDIEVILTDLGEVSTRDIAIKENPKGLSENIKVARRGGNISKITKELYEKEIYKKLKWAFLNCKKDKIYKKYIEMKKSYIFI